MGEDSLDSLLDGFFDGSVAVAAAPLDATPAALLGDEARLVERAASSRRLEFATGRRLSRMLLERLGEPAGPLLRDDDRVPLWPTGVVASISHCDDLCVVAMGRADRYRGIGIDVEPDEPISEEIERRICTASERTWIAARSAAGYAPGRARKLVFGAKEAVYKAFYPSVREFWGFQDVELALDPESERFVAALPPGAGLDRVGGRIGLRSRWLIAAVVVPR